MEPVLRAVAVYGLLLILFRVTGRRSLGQITTFDFILLLIISEAIQNAMVGTSYSIVNALVLVVSLMLIDMVLSAVKTRFPLVELWLEGLPLVIVEQGRPLKDRLRRSGLDEGDVMSAARQLHGLERMDQIKYAVLERNGEISIIPEKEASAAGQRSAA